jgi:hypothetical protein
MTLDQLYNQYKGETIPASLVGDSNASDDGQCFIWFDLVLNRVYGQPYFHATGAIDIWETPGVLLNTFKAIPYSPAMQIVVGDIVVYGTGVGSKFGHVSIAAQNGVGSSYVGYDSNWGDSKILQQIIHNDRFNATILGVLREELVMGVTIQGSPASVSTSDKRIDVFTRGSDNNLYQKTWTGSWQPWVEIGTGIFSDPAVSSWSVNRFDIFATGSAGDLRHWYWPDSSKGWSPVESLGTPS